MMRTWHVQSSDTDNSTGDMDARDSMWNLKDEICDPPVDDWEFTYLFSCHVMNYRTQRNLNVWLMNRKLAKSCRIFVPKNSRLVQLWLMINLISWINDEELWWVVHHFSGFLSLFAFIPQIEFVWKGKMIIYSLCVMLALAKW